MIEIHLNNLTKVRIHQLHHQINILELLQGALGRKCIQQSNDLHW